MYGVVTRFQKPEPLRLKGSSAPREPGKTDKLKNITQSWATVGCDIGAGGLQGELRVFVFWIKYLCKSISWEISQGIINEPNKLLNTGVKTIGYPFGRKIKLDPYVMSKINSRCRWLLPASQKVDSQKANKVWISVLGVAS